MAMGIVDLENLDYYTTAAALHLTTSWSMDKFVRKPVHLFSFLPPVTRHKDQSHLHR